MNFFIRAFNIDFITQFSIVTALVALINIGIGFLSKANTDIKELIENLPADKRGCYRPTQDIEKLAFFNYKKYTNKLFRFFVALIVIYFVLLIFQNVYDVYTNVDKVYLVVNGKFDIRIILEDTSTLLTNLFNIIIIITATVLTWVQMILLIIIYIITIVLLKNYKDVQIKSMKS